MRAVVVLVAAGKGTRMNRPTPKAFLPLAGQPLFVHSLRTLSQLEAVSRAVLATSADHCESAAAMVAENGPWPVPVEVIPGGQERQDSVAAGLQRVGDEELVLVHDAARPFITRECAERCLAAAAEHGAAIVAVKAHDTIKQAAGDDSIERTLDRDHIWLAQTPQIFRTEILRRAMAAAEQRGSKQTDDAALVEELGERVRLIAVHPDNRKITTAEDLEWAEWYVGHRHPK